MQFYVWQPRELGQESAHGHFSQVLDGVAQRYAWAYGEPFPTVIVPAGDCLVGVIRSSTGVVGGEAAPVQGPNGAVIAGVPEPEPTAKISNGHRPEPTPVEALRAALLLGRENPDASWRRAAHWRGRWAAVVWQDRRVAAANGISPGLRLWWTDGSQGWALGSLPGPLLALVARSRVIDLDVATLTAAFGHVASAKSLYLGVHRFLPGDSVLLETHEPPIVTPFVGFDEALGERRSLTYPDVVEEMANRAIALVGSAAGRSSKPRLSLSGGRDSRLLGAALVRAGHPILASTGGPAAAPDVVIARQVASLLGLEHKVGADARRDEADDVKAERARSGGGARALPITKDRLAAWVALHDGTAPLALARFARDLSVRRAAVASPPHQLFSGLGGETHRGALFPAARDLDMQGTARRGRGYVLDLYGSGMPFKRPVRELLADELRGQFAALGDESLPLSEWLARFYWRFRESFRGADTLAQADSVNWVFAPLMDLGFLALSREAPAATKTSSRLSDDVATLLVPELAGVPYDRQMIAYPPELVVTVLARFGLLNAARTVRRRLAGHPRPSTSVDAFRTLWEHLYFGPGDHLWPELIDERRLRRLVQDQPTGAIVRDLATPELLARAGSV